MKMFAINFLSDTLTGKEFASIEAFNVIAFANFIAYVINREIDLSDHLNEFSVESMVKDGYFGHSGMGYGEHIVYINLKLKDFEEMIEWDICNPDNQPEEFAKVLIEDLGLTPEEDYLIAISYEIRKQIKMSFCKRIQSFCNLQENFGQNELDIIDFNRSKDFPNQESSISHQIQYASSFFAGEATQAEFDIKDFMNQTKVANAQEIYFN